MLGEVKHCMPREPATDATKPLLDARSKTFDDVKECLKLWRDKSMHSKPNSRHVGWS